MAEQHAERGSTLERIQGFSDAVFAIGITLLALELVVPHLTGAVPADRLWQALGDDLPRFFSYVLSFVLIGQIWINYHRMLSYIQSSDHWLLWLNLLLLLTTSSYAFPTALLGEYALTPGAQTVAALVYGGWLTINGLLFNAIWWRAVVANLVAADLDPRHVRRLGRFWSLGLLLNVVVTLIALLSIWVSFLGFACLAIFYFLPPPHVGRVDARDVKVRMRRGLPRQYRRD